MKYIALKSIRYSGEIIMEAGDTCDAVFIERLGRYWLPKLIKNGNLEEYSEPEKAYSDMTKAELQAKLVCLGLPISGNKSDLIARLEEPKE